jgi:hypothetical protein
MMADVWFHAEKTIAKSIELGPEGFGRLIQDISEAVVRNDVEYLAQFDFVRTSDPGGEHCGDAMEPNDDCDSGQTNVAALWVAPNIEQTRLRKSNLVSKIAADSEGEAVGP